MTCYKCKLDFCTLTKDNIYHDNALVFEGDCKCIAMCFAKMFSVSFFLIDRVLISGC